MIYVILVEPENAGNIGAVARIMSNFGFENLVLINPKANYLSGEALARAMHGRYILKNALITDFSFLDKLDVKIATSSKVGNKRNIFRTPLDVRKLSKVIKDDNKIKIGLIFGRESFGLKNEEIERCDFLVTIPASKKNPVLNLSHAVGIILYELFKEFENDTHISHFELANKDEKRILLSMIKEILNYLEFNREKSKDSIILVFKRIVNRSYLARKEITTLLGFFRKVLNKIKENN